MFSVVEGGRRRTYEVDDDGLYRLFFCVLREMCIFAFRNCPDIRESGYI